MKKRLVKAKFGTLVVGVDTAGKMSGPHLAREVRRHFEKQAAAERSCQAASHIGEHREDPETRRRLISYLLWPFPFP